MDDLGNYKYIVYIIMAILYFFFTGKKKMAQKKAPPARQQAPMAERTPVNTPKPLISPPRTQTRTSEPTSIPENEAPYSLEDILRQFGQEPEKPYQEVKESKYESLEKTPSRIAEHEHDRQLKDEQLNRNKKVALGSINEVDLEEPIIPSIPKVVEVKTKNKYADMLNDPEGIKTAFIAGEIFNRKY